MRALDCPVCRRYLSGSSELRTDTARQLFLSGSGTPETNVSATFRLARGPVLLSHSLTSFSMTLRLEGRSVSGDQFRAASGRIFGGRFPLTSLEHTIEPMLWQ